MLSTHTQQWMSENGFSLNDIHPTDSTTYSPLTLACRQGLSMVAAELIALRSQLSLKLTDGTDSLWACIHSNAFDIAKQLLDKGVSINCQKENGASMLMYASSAGKTRWVEFLIENGADILLTTKDSLSAFELTTSKHCLHLLNQALDELHFSNRRALAY